jgi:hypothetical protein
MVMHFLKGTDWHLVKRKQTVRQKLMQNHLMAKQMRLVKQMQRPTHLVIVKPKVTGYYLVKLMMMVMYFVMG